MLNFVLMRSAFCSGVTCMKDKKRSGSSLLYLSCALIRPHFVTILALLAVFISVAMMG